jgi:hypothetical protein
MAVAPTVARHHSRAQIYAAIADDRKKMDDETVIERVTNDMRKPYSLAKREYFVRSIPAERVGART